MSNAQYDAIIEEMTQASAGARMRAANRGWSAKEQARCAKEAAEQIAVNHDIKLEDIFG